MLANVPNGPSICTVDRPATGDCPLFFFGVGGSIVKLTSGGIERGARPICDGREVDTEKDRRETIGKAGSRNNGKEIVDGETIAFPRPPDLAVENISSREQLCFQSFNAQCFEFGNEARHSRDRILNHPPLVPLDISISFPRRFYASFGNMYQLLYVACDPTLFNGFA